MNSFSMNLNNCRCIPNLHWFCLQIFVEPTIFVCQPFTLPPLPSFKKPKQNVNWTITCQTHMHRPKTQIWRFFLIYELESSLYDLAAASILYFSVEIILKLILIRLINTSRTHRTAARGLSSGAPASLGNVAISNLPF